MITLNHSQQHSFDEFCKFIDSSKSIFILKGAAGTGKTTLVKEFVRLLNGRHRGFSLMAPTGRASLILGKRTDCSAQTIHRTIYSLDSSPKKVEDRWEFMLKDNNDDYNHIYIIDEASMVSDIFQDNEMLRFGSGRLLSDLIEYCRVEHTPRKIVFIGDYAQLPPVGQNISPALSANYIEETFGLTVVESMLDTVVRQSSESAILANAEAIRKSIDTQTYNKFKITDAADVHSIDTSELETLYQQLGDQSKIIITHSNQQALQYNNRIRNLIFGKENMAIQPCDLLINTRNNYKHNNIIFNGTFLRVLSASPEVEVHQPFVGEKSATLRFRKIAIQTETGVEEAYILDDFLTDPHGSLPINTSKALWADFSQRMQKLKIYPSDSLFAEKLKSDPYYNALQCKYGYAITCHKSQGGEWDNVIVNMDTYMGKTNEMFFRWAYTALTRAKGQLWHISTPSFSAIDHIDIRQIQVCPTSRISYFTPNGRDWKEFRFANICKIASLIGIDCKDNRGVAYQHRVTFRCNEEYCELSLWYNKSFYTGRIQILKSTSEGFASTCQTICEDSLYLTEYKFNPRFPFQQELHNHIMNTASESGVRITNIEQKQWSDIYYLKTDAAAAYIEFFFNGKQIYTAVMPYSSDGDNDEAMKKFLSLL